MALVGLGEAQAHVLQRCPPLTPADVHIRHALGLVAAEEVRASDAVPPFANTAMDGFAVRSADTAQAPVVLRVTGTVAAGSVTPVAPVGAGEAVRIMTGAPMPEGADAVVMVERTSPAGEGRVRIEAAAAPGDHVRPAGDDLRPGTVLVEPGTVLTPGHLGVLASAGVARISAVPRPRVGVLSTGDELVDVDDAGPLRPGAIRDSNRHTLLALLQWGGYDGVDLGLAPDDEDLIASRLSRGLADCDAVLTSGGVSVGDFDYMKAVLDRLTAGSMRWMQVAIRPAKPFAFGAVGDKPVFGLPGNPVSSMVSFAVLAAPGLRSLAGHTQPLPPTVTALADDEIGPAPLDRTDLVRVVLTAGAEGALHVRSAGRQQSHLLGVMAHANGLAVIPPGGRAAVGTPVPVIPLGPPEVPDPSGRRLAW
ncbi:MAG TPA: gephyrin-like molybdotransferase Glp [Acidimicrobiales bacterium]|nr:gephyrin-like molybdotransferase Glp [Acidimicrobiales bacterium]